MSWHSGDWVNFSVAVASAISSIAASYAAMLSLKTTRIALKFQIKSSDLEKEIHIFEKLRDALERANSLVDGKHSVDWSFTQAANIIGAIDYARDVISDPGNFISDEKKSTFIRHFKNNLSFEITSALIEPSPPDAVFMENESKKIYLFTYYYWAVNKKFFGFPMPEDEDFHD